MNKNLAVLLLAAIVIVGALALLPEMSSTRDEVATIRLAEVRARTSAEVERQERREEQMATREGAWSALWVGLGIGGFFALAGAGVAIAGLGAGAALFALKGAHAYWERYTGALGQAAEPIALPPSRQWGGQILSGTTGSTLLLPIGVDQQQKEIAVPVDGKSVALLIAGQSGMGKSSLLRAMICAIADQASRVPAKIAVVNPKRVDLDLPDDSALLWAPVAETKDEITSLLGSLVAELDARNGHMAAQAVDVFYHAGLAPLVIIIDELSEVMDASDRTLRVLLSNIVRSGRAAGLFVVAATQSPRASVITGEIKNAARRRVAFAMQPAESQLVLSNASASSLPIEQGAAIYQDGVPVPVRTFHVEGSEWRQRIAATRTGAAALPSLVIPPQPQAESQEEKIRRLLADGMSQSAVEREVFGFSGGHAYREVRRVMSSGLE